MKSTRREFIGGIGAAGALGLAGCATGAKECPPMPEFGYCGGFDEKRAEKLGEVGFSYQEGSVGGILKPAESGWAELKKRILGNPIPFRGCNGFLPGSFRLTGPNRNHAPALDYAKIACDRADEVGLDWIVFGSAGARKAPEGYDRAKALSEYAEFAQRLAERIANNKVTIVLEPLQPSECNIFNFVSQGVDICRKIGSPRICQLADIFHMMRGNESADSILKAGPLLRHCHIAESKKRMFPREPGEFVPYFAALKTIRYRHRISTECGWPSGAAAEEAWKQAIACLRLAWEIS